MQENEFEKQVKQRMDEFRLRPSEPVWTEIEKELRGKRRRRFILIPLFAAFLLAGYFAWQFYFPVNKISSSAKEISIKRDSNSDQDKNAVSKNSDKINNPGNETNEKAASLKSAKEVLPAVKKSGAINISENTSKKEKNTDSKVVNRKKQANDIAAGNQPIVSLKKNGKQDHISDEVILGKANKEKNLNDQYKNETDQDNRPTEKNAGLTQPAEAGDAADNNLPRDNRPVMIDYKSFSNNLFTGSIAGNKLTGLQVPSFKNQDRLHSSYGIKFGISFSVGASSRVNKPLQVSSEDKSTASSTLYAGNNNPSFNNIGGGISILPPSDVSPGAAFKIGATTIKSLSRRFDISAGLQYSYSSDHIRVGKSLGSAVSFTGGIYQDVLSQAYGPGVQNVNHTNKYHFIELPVSVYFNLNRKWKMPFVWNAGLSAGRLVSSDVLLYDITWGGIYYKGNKDIRKTQVNMSTGFSIRFTGSNHWQWNIGPQVYMGVTKLFQSEYDKNKHPVYGGLNVQVLFPGKKR